ncbi:MAG: tetratricopeptide repeat protein, partial [Chloroflexota bacterium]
IIAWIYAALGAPDLFQSKYRAARDLIDTMPGMMRPWHLAVLSLHAIETGSLDAAADFHKRCLQLIALDGAFSPAHVLAFLARARLTFARGDYQAALEALEEMLARFREAGVRWLAADALYYRGRTLLAMDRPEEALVSLQQAKTAAERLNSRRVLWQINAALAGLEPAADKSETYRRQARQLVQYIVDHSGSPTLTEIFLAQPAVKALFDQE